MSEINLGNIIKNERVKRRISVAALSSGLCSGSALRKFELGTRELDYFIVERIIERLGRSVNKLELLYDKEIYRLVLLREVIENCLEEAAYEEAERNLDYYKEIADLREPLHLQYVKEVNAILLSERYGDHEGAHRLLLEALELTVPFFDAEDWSACFLGEEELVLLILLFREKEKKEAGSICRYSEALLSYISKHCLDEEVKANIYSKAAWIIGEGLMKRGRCDEALALSLEVVKVLTQNGLLIYVPQYLHRILQLSRNGKGSIHTETLRMFEALKALFEEVGEPFCVDGIFLGKNYRQNEIHLISELIKQERTLVGHSQESLALEIGVDPKTLSRIECGKVRPKPGTMSKFIEFFGMEKNVYSTRLLVGDFALLEVEREVAMLAAYQENKESELRYHELKKEIPLHYKENLQYIAFMDAFFKRKSGKADTEKTIEKFWEAFFITKEKVEIGQLGGVLLDRRETVILVNIALSYRDIGKDEEAILLLEKVLEGYENSKVELRYHYASLILIYENLGILYEEADRFEDAVQIFDRAIRYEISCKRGNHLGFLLVSRTYTTDRMRGDNTGSLKFYLQGHRLCELYGIKNRMDDIACMYRLWYGEEIERI